MNKKTILISIAAVLIIIASFIIFKLQTNKQTVSISKPEASAIENMEDDSAILADNSYSDVQGMLGQLGFQLAAEPFKAPDFEIKDIQGNSVRLSDYRGQPVLFNLWATWCPPCRQEMPSMEKLYQKYKDEGFVILAASSSLSNDTLEKVQNFAKKEKLSFPILFDDQDAIDYSYFTQSIPTSYIIDSNGTLIARLIGAIDWDTPQMGKIIEELLK